MPARLCSYWRTVSNDYLLALAELVMNAYILHSERYGYKSLLMSLERLVHETRRSVRRARNAVPQTVTAHIDAKNLSFLQGFPEILTRNHESV